MISGKRSRLPLPDLAVALIFLSILINFDYPAQRYFSWRLLLPAVDVWLLLIVLAVAACFGKRTLFLTGLSAWALFLVLRLFRIGEVAVPLYLDRSFNLYIDSGYLFGLYDLLKTSSRQGDFFRLAAGAITVALGVIISSWYAWRMAARAFWDNRLRIWFLTGSSLILAAVLVRGGDVIGRPVMARFGREIIRIHEQIAHQQTFFTQLQKTARERRTHAVTLKGLNGADVLIFIVESYGRIVFSSSQFRQKMETIMTGFAKTLGRHGFYAVSSYLVSPTYGGSSWLAHGTLESGLRVENDLEEAALLRSPLPPLAWYFRRSGYRTISVMPGTRFAYPEGAYFNYDQVYYARHFHYRGPPFGWAPMPDQFVLDWIRRREFVRRKQPLFVRYVLISSHAAFNIQPQFIPDWAAIGDGGIYSGKKPIYYPVYWPDLKNAADAYLRSLDYEFTVLGDYLARYVTRDTLIVIMGDHQPNIQLTGPGEPWSVPVHVISRDLRLLTPFRRRGYTPGVIPGQAPPHKRMETFLPGLLEDFKQPWKP
jgi:hypothetical protein